MKSVNSTLAYVGTFDYYCLVNAETFITMEIPGFAVYFVCFFFFLSEGKYSNLPIVNSNTWVGIGTIKYIDS